jgi:hypothetical protein
MLCLPLMLLAGGAGIDRTTVRIVSCHDGGTCRAAAEILPGRDRIRLANADTPEIEGQCPAEIKQAMMARDDTRAVWCAILALIESAKTHAQVQS